jgi:fibronectin-binding autotransporter adhesin
MNHPFRRLALAAGLVLSSTLVAQSSRYWEIGNGTWDTSTENWSAFADGSGGSIAFSSGSAAVFSVDSFAQTITVSGVIDTSAITLIKDNTTFNGGELTSTDQITVNSGFTGTFNTILSGSQSITKAGDGTLILNGANTSTGGMIVSAGTLAIGNNTASGSVASDITNNSTLIFNRTDDYTFDHVISGTGDFILDGYILRFDQAQTYTGSTTINAGGYLVLATDVDQGLSAATTVDVAAGGFFDFSNRATTLAGLTGAGDVYSFGGSNGHLTLDVATGQSYDFSGELGAGAEHFALTKAGAGTQVLSGTNTYTGSTNISGGTLSIAADAALGSAPGAATPGHLTLDGGTLATTATFTLDANRGIALGSAGGTLSTADATTLTYDGILAGSGGLTKTGDGNLILSAASTHSGDTTVSAGTLTLGNSDTLQNSTANLAGGDLAFGNLTTANFGGLAGSTDLALANGSAAALALNVGSNDADTTYSGTLSGAGSLTKSGTGTLTLSGTNTYAGGTTITAGTLSGTAASLPGDIVNNASLVFDQTTDASYAGTLSGTGSLTKSGVGNLTLDNASNRTGDTTVSAGAITLGDTNTAQHSTITLSGGTLQFGNLTSATIGGLAGSSDLALTNGSDANVTVTVGGNDASTAYSGILAGGGALTKTGNGTLTLSGNNSFAGDTTVSSGTLALGNSNALQNSTATLSGGTLDFAALTTATFGGLAGSGDLALTNDSDAAVALSVGGNDANTTYSGILAGSGGLTKTGDGNLILSTASTHSGDTTVSAGTLTLGNSDTLQNSTANLAGGDLAFGNLTTANFGGLAGSTDLALANGSAAALALNVGSNDADTTYSGTLSGAGSLTKSGTGTLTLSGTNTYAGDTTLSGGTLALDHSNALQNSTATLSGGTLDFAALTTATFGGLAGSSNLALTNGSDDAVALTVGNNNADTTYSGVLSDAGSVTKVGTGNLALTGNNTFSGSTTISGGTLTGTTASLPGNVVNNAALVFDQSTSGTYAHLISGTGTLAKTGSGTVTLSGANTYAGGTTLNDGTLAIAADSGLGVAPGSTTAGHLTINGGTLATTASFELDANRGLTFGASGGTLDVSSGTTLTYVPDIAGNFTKSGTGTLELTSITALFNKNIEIAAGDLHWNTPTGTFTTYQRGVLSGAGNLIITGTTSSARELEGVNTYTGTTTLRDGFTVVYADSGLGAAPASATPAHLIFEGGILIPGASFTIDANRGILLNAAGGTLDTNGHNVDYAGIMTGTGSFTKTDSGTLTLTGANTHTGGTTVSGGTLRGTTSSLRGDILNNSSVVFDQNTDDTYTGVLSGSGALTKSGTGNVTLSGNNTYSGGTTVSAGTLTGTTSSLQGDFTNNAAVVFDQTTDGTYAGAMSGSGALTRSGTGNLTLSGNNAYTGGTTVSAGTLTGTTSSLQGDVTNNAAVVFDQATAGTFAGAMSGSGSLTKSGSGNVTLSAANTFTGDTTIDAGSLTLGHADALQNSTLTTATGLSFGELTSANLGGLTGSQNLALTNDSAAAVTLTMGGNDASSSYSGIFSGTGALTKSGTGDLTLSGANTFTGDTTIDAGSLTLGHADALQNSTLTTATGLSFGELTSANLGGLTGSQNLALTNGSAAAVALTMGGNDASSSYSGIFSGTGSLTKSGTGNLTLSGANAYTGGTTVSAGTLTGTSSSLQGDITNNAAVVFDQTTDGTYAGAMSGSGALTKSGTGNLTLSGANAYTGGTTVSAGTLTGTTSSLQGDVTNNAAVVFDQAADGTYAGVMSGTGSLTTSDSGNITLSGNNTYTGGTTVSAGTLTLGAGGASGSVAGNITNNGTVVFNRSDDYAYLGVVSGSGGLTHDGHILRFDKAQTYTGPTAIEDNSILVLTIHADQGLAASTTVDLGSNSVLDFSNRATTFAGLSGEGSVYSFGGSAGHLTLETAADTTFSFAGALGAGAANFALTKSGDGTQVLSGNNTYTGDTTISEGTLRIGAGGTTGSLGTGNVINNAALVFDRSDSTSVANDISGTGTLTKLGNGILTLAGSNSYSGNTNVTDGTLLLNATTAIYGGTIDAANTARISVADGATLGLGVGGSSSFSVSDISVVAANTDLGAGAKLALDTTSATNGSATLSGLSTGAVNLQKTGSGTLLLAGTSSGTGTMEIANGTLSYDAPDAFLGGALNATNAAKITVADGATLGLGIGGASSFSTADVTTVNQNVNFTAGSSLGLDTTNATSGAATLNDLNFGATGLTKIGDGSLTLTGTTTLTGATTIQGGSLIIGSDALLGAAPGSATAGHLTLDGGSLNTTSTFSLDTNRGVAIGSSGGTLDVAEGTTLTLAGDTSGSGALNKSGSGTLTLTQGSASTGNLTISAGTLQIGNGGTTAFGASNITNHAEIVFDHSNEVTLDDTLDGTGNFTKSGSGTLNVNRLSSTGTLTVTAGNLNSSSDIDDRSATISGATASWTDSSSFNDIGRDATGSLSITDGGSYVLSSTSSLNFLTIGTIAGSNGTVTVNGSDSNITSSGRLRVASGGTGALDIENGGSAAFNRSSDSFVGNTSTGVGTVTLSGTDSTLTTGGRLVIGNAGIGTMNIGSGSTVTSDRIQLAQDAGSTGTLNLNTGGTLVVSDATDTAVSSGDGTATFNFAGGTLKSNGAHDLTVSSNATLADGTTSTFDTNGQAGSWTGILSGTGHITKAGTGTLTLSGANTHTGTTTISAGTLALDATGTIAESSRINLGTTGTLDVTAKSSFNIGSGQTLSGTGTVALGGDTLTLTAGATFAPGNSAGLVTIDGNFTLNSASIINLELGGLGRGTTYDAFDVTGNLNIGGTLNIVHLGDYSPSVGDAFQIFTASSIGGTFAEINISGFAPGIAFNTSALATSGVLSVSAVPEPSTFALLFGGAALGFTATRRRRRS